MRLFTSSLRDDLSASIYGLPLQIVIQTYAFHTFKTASGCFGGPEAYDYTVVHRTNRTFGHTALQRTDTVRINVVVAIIVTLTSEALQ